LSLSQVFKNDDVGLMKVIPQSGFVDRLYEVIRRGLVKKMNDLNGPKVLPFEFERNALAPMAWLLFHDLRQGVAVDFEKYRQIDQREGRLVVSPAANAWYSTMIKEKQKSLESLYGEASFELIEPSAEDISHFQAAENFIKEHHSGLHEVYQRCVSHVFIAKSRDLVSFTIPKALGVIVVAPKPSWSLAHYVEAIVHESAHVELTMRQQIDPLLKNRSELSSNPLRQDPRPLDGTFHAAMVMLRVCLALLSLPNSKDALDIIGDYFSKLDFALSEISSKADFTECGRRLFEDMNLQYSILKIRAEKPKGLL
jgi:hypothetical protein